MGVDIIAVYADWEPAVAAYREAGTDVFFPGDEDEELPFAERHWLGGFKRFLNTGDFYLRMVDDLSAEARASTEPFLRLIGAFEDDQDWGLEFPPSNELLADAGGPPPEDPVLFALRPETVRTALVLAAGLPWPELRTVADGVDREGTDGDLWCLECYDDLRWVLSTYIDWMKGAATAGRGLIVIASI